MSYALREGLSYCEVDEHLIFLDLPNDRYFQLPDRLAPTFRRHAEGRDRDESSPQIERLLELGVLVRQQTEGRRSFRPRIRPPGRSLLEASLSDRRIDALVLAEISSLIVWMRIGLATRRLCHVLERVAGYRARRVATVPSASTALDRIERACSAFRQARPYVPIEPCCLLDTLSIVAFLARRRLGARLVFGVAHLPFSAHCWAQVDEVVLNDTLGNVRNHTPILVV